MRTIIYSLIFFTWIGPLYAADSVTAARGVLERVMGNQAAKSITLTIMPKDGGGDRYIYQASGGKLQIKGTSTVAMCRGVYDYLRAKQLGTVGWAGARVNVPKQWPDAPITTGGTPFQIRHCYNVVTFGYTTPYWNWTRWQQELDWMAMHGYNMIMAPVATEAIATMVWREIGLTKEEIDDFYTGPAHLPWQRMGNIQHVGGSLSDAWHRDQIILQKKLLGRMRELGIEPVIQSFAGFAPKGIKRVHPELVLHNTLWNGGFPATQRPVVMMPDSPVFADIMKRFITRWKATFGEAKYFLVDSFNEMELPKTSTPPAQLLAGYGRKTYDAIIAADHNAVWVLQGWMFNYQRNIWNRETVKSLVESVPADRLLILDFANDYNANWDEFSGFHGRSWMMGYVPNMGGKTAQCGKMDFYATQAAKTLASPDKGNLAGFTISGEGLENNEVIYELMSDSAWSTSAVNLDQWLPAYAANRYGNQSPVVAAAWMDLRKSVYSSFTPHPSFGWQTMNAGTGSAHRSDAYVSAVRKFLSAAETLEGSKNYQDDAVEMAALVLSIKAEDWYTLARKAHEEGQAAVLDQAAARANELLLQADRLLESHSYLRLQRWIDFARSHDGSEQDKADWERNARQIVTVWGPPVNDYSCRVWSGLIRDFYAPRMQQMLDCLKNGRRMDRGAWEKKWVDATGVSQINPYPHPALAAKDLVEKACTEVMPSLDVTDANLLGTWEPGKVSSEWRAVEWPLTIDQFGKLKGVKFLFTKGNHRLLIRYAAVVADGKVIADDRHDGLTGDHHVANDYHFKIPTGSQANNSCVLRAEVRTEGGEVSNGKMLLLDK